MPCSFWTKLTILGHSGSVRRTSTMPYATVNRYKKHPISPGDLNIPSFEIPFIDSESVSPLTGFEKDPLPLQSGILLPFLAKLSNTLFFLLKTYRRIVAKEGNGILFPKLF